MAQRAARITVAPKALGQMGHGHDHPEETIWARCQRRKGCTCSQRRQARCPALQRGRGLGRKTHWCLAAESRLSPPPTPLLTVSGGHLEGSYGRHWCSRQAPPPPACFVLTSLSAGNRGRWRELKMGCVRDKERTASSH